MVKSARLSEVEERWGEVKSQAPSVEVRWGAAVGRAGVEEEAAVPFVDKGNFPLTNSMLLR